MMGRWGDGERSPVRHLGEIPDCVDRAKLGATSRKARNIQVAMQHRDERGT